MDHLSVVRDVKKKLPVGCQTDFIPELMQKRKRVFASIIQNKNYRNTEIHADRLELIKNTFAKKKQSIIESSVLSSFRESNQNAETMIFKEVPLKIEKENDDEDKETLRKLYHLQNLVKNIEGGNSNDDNFEIDQTAKSKMKGSIENKEVR